MLTEQTCCKIWQDKFSLSGNIIKYNLYDLITCHIAFFYMVDRYKMWPLENMEKQKTGQYLDISNFGFFFLA